MELPLTPLDLLARARRLFADRVGVIDGDERWTYGEFAARCDRLGHALQRDLDVQPGQVVAWLGGNTHELLEAYYGVLLAGGVLLPLNIRLAPAELRAILDASGAVVLFRHPDQPDPGHPVRTVVLGDEHEALLAAQPDGPVATPPVDEHAAAELFYTSGSTGTPKGALLSHRGLYLHAIHSALTMGLTGDDVFLHTIPLFHVNGWGTPHFVTGLGGVHVMLPRFDAGEVLRLVEAHGVTRLFLVPAMARLVLDHPDAATRDLSSVVQISVGGASASAALLAELEDAFELRGDLRLRHDGELPHPHAQPPDPGSAVHPRAARHHRSPDPRRRRAGARRRRRRGAVGRADRSARSAPGATT